MSADQVLAMRSAGHSIGVIAARQGIDREAVEEICESRDLGIRKCGGSQLAKIDPETTKACLALIEARRLALGWSKTKLSESIGEYPQVLGHIYSGRMRLSVARYVALMTAMGIEDPWAQISAAGVAA